MAQESRSGDRTAGLGARALRYTVLMLAARVVSRLIALAAVVLMGNSLGADGFGQLQTAITYGALVGTFTDLGFTTLYVREGARRPEQLRRYFDNVTSAKLLLLVIALPALLALLWFAGIQSLLLPAFALLITNAYSLQLRNTLYAMQRLGFEIAEIVPEALLLLGLTVLGAVHHADAGFYLWAYAASYFAACIWFLVVLTVKGVLRPHWRLEVSLLRDWVRAGIPLAITYILTTVYFKLDVPILQHVRGNAEVGWYTLAYKPFESLTFLPLTLRTIAFPIFSLYFSDAPNRILASAEKLFKALFIMGWPISVGLFVLAPQFNTLLHLYPESEAALRILSVAIVFMFVDNTFAATLNAIDRQKAFAYVAMSGLLINVAINLVVIPLHGYIGASWATVATEVALVAVGWLALRRYLGSIRVVHSCWRALIAGVAMGGFVAVINPHGTLWLLLVTVAAAAVYAAALLALRVIDSEERGLIRRALPGRGTTAD